MIGLKCQVLKPRILCCQMYRGCNDGFTFWIREMPLLRAMRFMLLHALHYVIYIISTVLCWQHFPRLVFALPGGSVGHGYKYLDLHWVLDDQNNPKLFWLFKTHLLQWFLEVWMFVIIQSSDFLTAINSINVPNSALLYICST